MLAFDTTVVTVVLGGDGSRADVVQGSGAVEFLTAGGGQHGAQFGVLQWRGGAHLDPTESVDHRGETGEIDSHETVDGKSGDLLDRLDQTLGATEGIGRVELAGSEPLVVAPLAGIPVVHRSVSAGFGIPCLAVDRCDPQVAGEGDSHHTTAIGGDVDQHDGVGAGPLGDAGIACPDLSVRAYPAVDADDQEVFVAILGIAVADVTGVRVQRRDGVQQAVFRALPLPCRTGDSQRRHCDEHGRRPGGQQRRASAAAARACRHRDRDGGVGAGVRRIGARRIGARGMCARGMCARGMCARGMCTVPGDRCKATAAGDFGEHIGNRDALGVVSGRAGDGRVARAARSGVLAVTHIPGSLRLSGCRERASAFRNRDAGSPGIRVANP